MRELLFLCHRLPYPPNKGDKIRSYHLLRHLAENYRVHLGTFVDEPEDWQHVAAVEKLCAGSCIRPLKPLAARLRALIALARAEPFTVAYYRDRSMQRWVDGVLSAGTVETVVAFSSGMAPYLLRGRGPRRIMDFVDVDSDKWRQYAQTRGGIAGMIYRREAGYLADFEQRIAAACDASVFVSGHEAEFFRQRVPGLSARIHGIPNGVDTEYWDPALDYPNPYGTAAPVLVFVGAMDYWANAEGAQWFARTVWPRIHRELPAAHFYIVGANPSRPVRALAAVEGIVVTGRVADVRPYVRHAHAVVAPLRIARGIQNKVLEALAMGKALLATPQAYEGIEEFAERPGCISDAPEILAGEALRWLRETRPAAFPAVRQQVLSRYNWRRMLARFDSLLEAAPVADRSAAESGAARTREAYP
ncbi:MAG: TIGR03087 family PEP-CTERM/XrtA system glycosyltransferase [Gammaproteobacteria bacterium]|nr:TIGR03087 family PEP-CTERM/XrtA system glycosyltransferase [Gammaproteobacteria bacterium]